MKNPFVTAVNSSIYFSHAVDFFKDAKPYCLDAVTSRINKCLIFNLCLLNLKVNQTGTWHLYLQHSPEWVPVAVLQLP